jgi:Stress responsive A/B Barrel Domain
MKCFLSPFGIPPTMKMLLTLVFAAVLSSCATIAPPAPKGSVDHVVLMWQKKPGNASDRKQITDAIERLRVIDGITILDYGTALPSERAVVDDSFDIGLLVRFKDADALHAYETDPRHVKEVKGVLLPLTKKIQVYDIIR